MFIPISTGKSYTYVYVPTVSTTDATDAEQTLGFGEVLYYSVSFLCFGAALCIVAALIIGLIKGLIKIIIEKVKNHEK